MRALIVTLGVLILMPNQAPAQPERFELGQRLKAFEKEWDKQTDPAARKRALAILPKVTEKFFTFQLGEAGRVLDQARWALTSDKPMLDDVAWAWSLYAVPDKRLIDRATEKLNVKIKPFYQTKVGEPKQAQLIVKVTGRKPIVIESSKIAEGAKFDFPTHQEDLVNEELSLEFVVKINESTVADSRTTVSRLAFYFTEDGPNNFYRNKIQIVPPKEANTLEAASSSHLLALMDQIRLNNPLEMAYPLYRIYKNAQDMLNPELDSTNFLKFFTPTRHGDFWMAFLTGKDQRTPARLFVPEKLDPKKQVPLVVALHGIGGSENLFFEGYGDGQIVKLCKERGWLLVAPRCPLFGTPPVAEIVEQLSKRYPVDAKRVFLVGHSMGAAQSVELVQKYPKLFAGVALLGGGGRVTDAKAFAELPTFLGIGTKDQLAFGMAKDLNKTLTTAKAGKLLYKEYEDLEHLVIVREALPDAFKMFNTVK
jgi:predicted esterase